MCIEERFGTDLAFLKANAMFHRCYARCCRRWRLYDIARQLPSFYAPKQLAVGTIPPLTREMITREVKIWHWTIVC
jgi:hypothetical protein